MHGWVVLSTDCHNITGIRRPIVTAVTVIQDGDDPKRHTIDIFFRKNITYVYMFLTINVLKI